jgi:hypothetical protein
MVAVLDAGPSCYVAFTKVNAITKLGILIPSSSQMRNVKFHWFYKVESHAFLHVILLFFIICLQEWRSLYEN